MNGTARNYHAHGGSEWVIGGKITFLPGAVVEGAEGLFDLPTAELLESSVLPCIPASEATTIAQLRESFNHLLAVMKEAGVMVSEIIGTPVEDAEPDAEDTEPVSEPDEQGDDI